MGVIKGDTRSLDYSSHRIIQNLAETRFSMSCRGFVYTDDFVQASREKK